MTDRATPIWPFPGQEGPWWEAYPPHNLPPPRFAPGDRVTTRWGSATVQRVYDCEYFDGRLYQLRYDWSSSAPPGFGHRWSENDMEQIAEGDQPAQVEADPQPQPPVLSDAPTLEQLELFA
jgi:hypothetical protein